VAITRPKDFLFLIGNRDTLSVKNKNYEEPERLFDSKHNIWHDLINEIEASGGYYRIDTMPENFNYSTFKNYMEN
jgi:hypothetical protein